MAEIIFFDSNIYINILRSPDPASALVSFLDKYHYYALNKIVLMELWSGVQSTEEETVLKYHQESLPLIGLSDDQFIEAGYVMHSMRKQYQFEPKKRRQITWDILIALSAKENKALLITENKEDFQTIQKFVDFEFATS